MGIPTTHDFRGAIHLGYGLFKVETPEYEIYFDGGGAMRRTPSGKGWTRIQSRRGEYPYDTEAVRATLQAYLGDEAAPIQIETHTLTFGDNGVQTYFEGDQYIVFNPYLKREGQRYASGWVWHYRDASTGYDWCCVPDPEIENTCIGAFSLREAVVYAERVLGVRFELVGAPDDLPDSYPVHQVWREPQVMAEPTDDKALDVLQKESDEDAGETWQPWTLTLEQWVEIDHTVRRTGDDMRYIAPDGRKTLWPGVTSRWLAIVSQHRYEVHNALSKRCEVRPDVLNEYPDLAEKYSVSLGPNGHIPIWRRTRDEFSLTHPAAVNDVPIGKREVTKARIHAIVVERAMAAGYEVPDHVLADYPCLEEGRRPQEPLADGVNGCGTGGNGRPPSNGSASHSDPTPEDQAEFERWKLHLLTGIVNGKRDGAFYRALKGITQPGTLRLALEQVPAADERRRALIEQQLKKMEE